jgi:hypothetical protein
MKHPVLRSVECYEYYCEWSVGNCMKKGYRGETGVSVSAAGVWSEIRTGGNHWTRR